MANSGYPAERGERLIDDLVGGLTPVRKPNRLRDAAVLALLGAVEVALYAVFHGMRGDMGEAMAAPAFWWKALSLAALAGAATTSAVRSLDPAAVPRRRLWRPALLVAAIIALGWTLDAASGGMAGLTARLDPRGGLECVSAIVALSLPALAALGYLMRRGAPTDPGGTAALIGLAAAAWGGLVFVLACPHDDPLYVAIWFAVPIGAAGLLARLVLPRLNRW